jgi:hypothetical protein
MTEEKYTILGEFHSALGDLIVDKLVGKVTPEEVNKFYIYSEGDSFIAKLLMRAEQIKQILNKDKPA